MSRRAAAVAIAIVSVVLLGLGAPAAHADDAQVTAAAAAWFWARQSEPAPVVGVAPPAASDPTVPDGDIAVAGPSVDGDPEKVAYVAFPVDMVPSTATLDRFVVTLGVDPAGTQAFDESAPPVLIACAVRDTWAAAEGPQAYSTRPADDCAAQAVGRHDAAAGSWSFDVTAIAQRWMGSGLNTGVVITPGPVAASAAFQVVFGPPAALRAQVSWIAAVPAPVGVPVPARPTRGAPSAPSGPGFAPAPAPGLGPAPAATTGPVPTPLAGPVVAAPVSQAARAASSRRAALGPVLGAGSALAVLLVACGVVLGAPRRAAVQQG